MEKPMHKSHFSKPQTAKGLLSCTLCNHYCTIKEGRTGICGVRKNAGSFISSLVYGYPVAVNSDPIEKKPLFHFLPGSATYSIGTFGCNLVCQNCQNFQMSHPKQVEDQIEELIFTPPEKIVEEALANECTSISYTYNEPTVFSEYARDIMELARECGLKNVWVSNGYMSKECLDDLLYLIDAVNIDLKSFDERFYAEQCGSRLKPILENIVRIKRDQVHLELTTLIVPTLSDDPDMLRSIAEFIAGELDTDTPWHISRFSPEISWKLKKLPPTGEDIIYEAYDIGKEAGLKYVYVGNLPGDQKENTYCPSCGELAIERYGYQIERFDSHGACSHCDKSLDIVDK